MVFGGVQKNSFIDFPGKVSCVLFLSGCNFRCPYCHNPELVRSGSDCPAFINESWVLEFLKKRKGLLDAVVISGGEPTLHPDLFELCDRLKQLDYPVKVDTNGSRPEVIRELIKKHLVDYVAMDVKTDPHGYAPHIQSRIDPRQILGSIDIIMGSGIGYEFRTTCIKPLVDERVIESISRLIQGAPLYALQRFRRQKVLQPEFFRTDTFSLTDRELAHFKAIAEPFVTSCVVR